MQMVLTEQEYNKLKKAGDEASAAAAAAYKIKIEAARVQFNTELKAIVTPYLNHQGGAGAWYQEVVTLARAINTAANKLAPPA